MTYNRSPYTEAQLQDIDNGAPIIPGPLLLRYEKTLADDLLTIRALRTREYWRECCTCRMGAYPFCTEEDWRLVDIIWKKMDGDTCRADALRLIARKV